ncbi:DUF4829 domain-containing protein [Isachenkonia alkalipeptolytica]|uniref:DUF4829 domain-containing protein n=1 Tax=Isachenkonia alkalipeptolytica TaxID=2565777 RepID=A0AA43XN13_9CLOT|nr:DUF4829 domain-containing protein [Isachenkonia alkalipeptolytica]NBG89476.1 DUF4829 domain-containing protein [Isachenkonia alkalipeptolytica]
MKKGIIIGLGIVAVVVIVALSAYNGMEEETSDAEAVIQEYHQGLLDRDVNALQGLQVNRGENTINDQMWDGLNNVEVLSIQEDQEAKDWYIGQRQGEDEDPENILAFEVQANFDYENYASLYYMSGVQKRMYFLVREKENSPWLIEYIKLI